MLGTLLIVWGFGTLFGSIALGKWEEHCSKPKEEKTKIPKLEKPTLPVVLAWLFNIICWAIILYSEYG